MQNIPAQPVSTLDIEAPGQLAAYLAETRRTAPGEEVSTRTLTGGVSNRTVLVRRRSGPDWVVKQALPKLRVEVDWFCPPDRIVREAAGLRWLGEVLPPGSTPALVFDDPEHHLLCMEAVPEPHEPWKRMLLDGRVEEDLVRCFGELLGTIHRAGAERRSLAEPLFGDTAVFDALRLEPYYEYCAERVPAAADPIRRLVEETREERLTVVHGDYSPKNLLVHDGRLVLLDHEVIHFGDPAFDLGFAMTHLLSKAHHLPRHRERFAEAALRFWSSYLHALGRPRWLRELEPRAVRHTAACLVARAAGRSPLEYLSRAERDRQREAAVALLVTPPPDVASLVRDFLDRL